VPLAASGAHQSKYLRPNTALMIVPAPVLIFTGCGYAATVVFDAGPIPTTAHEPRELKDLRGPKPPDRTLTTLKACGSDALVMHFQRKPG